jgi:hypothetical protein
MGRLTSSSTRSLEPYSTSSIAKSRKPLEVARGLLQELVNVLPGESMEEGAGRLGTLHVDECEDRSQPFCLQVSVKCMKRG